MHLTSARSLRFLLAWSHFFVAAFCPMLSGAYLSPADSDGDGLEDAAEVSLGTDPDVWDDVRDPALIDRILQLVYDWQIARPSEYQTGGDGDRSWVGAAFYAGATWWALDTGNTLALADMRAVGERTHWALGDRLRVADDHCIAQTYLQLYLHDTEADADWIRPTRLTFNQILRNPIPFAERSPFRGQGPWGSTDWYSWCDALFMAPPAWAMYATVEEDGAYLDFLVDEWQFTADESGGWQNSHVALYDSEEGLFFRDVNFVDELEPNGRPEFWSRGNGWVIGGLCGVLEYFPAEDLRRSYFVDQLRQMAAALADAQVTSDDAKDGLWTSSILYPDGYAEPEMSGSAFFVYGLAYGVNHGILDPEEYGSVIERGWEGLAHAVRQGGAVDWIQPVGKEPGSNETTDPFRQREKHYGYGAYLLAGTEVAQFFHDRDFSAHARFSEVESLGGGMYESSWYGMFSEPFHDRSGWVFSNRNGWQWLLFAGEDRFFAYDYLADRWFWFSRDAFPWIWSSREGWVYLYQPNGTPTDRWFWSFERGRWYQYASP